MAGTPTGWDDLLNSSMLSRHKGHISMLNDMREAIGTALIYRGFSPNGADPDQIEVANSTILRYPAPNAEAYKLTDPTLDGANYRLLSGIKLYSIEDLGEAGHLYEKIWTELKAR